MDPDSYAVPVLTSVVDVIGNGLLLCSFVVIVVAFGINPNSGLDH